MAKHPALCRVFFIVYLLIPTNGKQTLQSYQKQL